ncbi:hypothetical protein Pan44_23050 [Caulifigura coniformis]|uniref:Uncharacterized protein n=1 Tax=Caulifigura coniformis TaxID=2527983 RepID=A0A517SDU4_9PLAN|nr:hypothetical protein Pan44_23050 [Caulifigura coniformis]
MNKARPFGRAFFVRVSRYPIPPFFTVFLIYTQRGETHFARCFPTFREIAITSPVLFKTGAIGRSATSPDGHTSCVGDAERLEFLRALTTCNTTRLRKQLQQKYLRKAVWQYVSDPVLSSPEVVDVGC